MLRRCCLVLALFVPLLTAAREPIAYTLSFPAAARHYADVEAVIPTDGAAELTLFMPTWTPGSYLIREYSRNIIDVTATDAAGTPLTVEKTSKNRWQITTAGADAITVAYRLFCREINVRSNWVERDFAVINGAPTYLTVADDFQRPYTVSVELPEGWVRSESAMTYTDAANTFTAPDFDTLVDSPLIAGSPQVDTFEVDGVLHRLVTIGGGDVWDNTRAARNLQKVVEIQRDFWGFLPYDEPYTVFNLLTGDRGGLEHRQSFTMTADRWYASTRGGIKSWLSLVSHEFFHAWNGKRLRPVELGPFDYEHENYTPSLWIVEGLTSYYQHLLLTRGGYNTPAQYLRALSGSIAGTQRTPGRLVQSLSDSSFDAWIKAYRRDENSLNTLFSYYGGGAVAGFIIDAQIQIVSNGQASLDDVMQAAYERYSGEHGYSEAEFIALAGEIAGADLTAWFDELVHHPGEFDYQPALDWFGLEFEAPRPPPSDDAYPVADEPVDRVRGWLGANTKSDGGKLVVSAVPDGTPAAAAGLAVDDELIAIDHHRVGDNGTLNKVVRNLGADTAIDLLVSRQGLLLTLPATLAAEPTETWQLKVRSDATDAQKARVAKWLQTDDGQR
ncbi:M61 family metallopeptidase [Actomonas aquatica]|uniref:PDZ domain-containing protein n=1 Tax=Actomonas aquatica TaxID=2866162 RepID=A0ABZ1C2J3_9BACT|nr:PDZ domain-containing protein [Opitutus sp. WL0086]WRQ85933.1 PDZ domain-containing protein [Opitutus sp. WL0086]